MTDVDRDRCVRAVRSRDTRFDGRFVTAVTSTRIYCRPSCPVVPPKVENMTFYRSAAGAQRAGFRACKRCRPDASVGSPEWNLRADLVARAMRLIADGVVDRDGVGGLADRLGYSVRQIERQLVGELGAGPLALARAQRAQTARVMVETTDLRMGEVALAAGFASLRSFNQTLRDVFGLAPSELRARSASPGDRSASGSLDVRLPYRGPLYGDDLFGHLAAAAVPGVEEWRDGVYRRTLRLDHGTGIVELAPPGTDDGGVVDARLHLTDLRDLTSAISRSRRLLDLDADPAAIAEHLGADPVLAPLVAAAPGRRIPGTVDPAELAVRAVLAHRGSRAARADAARLVVAHGEPIDDPTGGLTHLFPSPTSLAAAGPNALGLPTTVDRAVTGLVGALAEGTLPLDAGSDREHVRVRLAELPGIGPSTIETIVVHGLGDPDGFAPDDLAAGRALRRTGLGGASGSVAERARSWSPWRAYAIRYLLAADDRDEASVPGGERSRR